MRKTLTLLFGLVALLFPGWAWAQGSLTPRVVQVDTITCQELLSLTSEQRDRLLIYLSGYFDGKQQATTWNERVTGERIDRALAQCRAKPEAPMLRVFADTWAR
jgi:hypothetical protein